MKIEKLKAPLIPGPKGGDKNDWCIHVSKGGFIYTLLSGALIIWILCHVIAFSEDKAGMLPYIICGLLDALKGFKNSATCVSFEVNTRRR